MPYKVGEEHYCPAEAPTVSPFSIFEYITHIKARSGPVAFAPSTAKNATVAAARGRGAKHREQHAARAASNASTATHPRVANESSVEFDDEELRRQDRKARADLERLLGR